MPHNDRIGALPKAELHLHIEGTLEPELALDLAQRNGVELPFADADQLRAAYRFENLQSFLDLYYALTVVLRTEADFTELAGAYLRRAAAQGVRHAEIFFDPQAHIHRGVELDTVVAGLQAALETAPGLGVSTRLIMCFLRDLSEADALAVFEAARPWFGTVITGIGLDSTEIGNPPAKFTDLFRRAREAGLHRVAHAGEEGPAANITDALDLLQAERVDHGVRCLEDPALVARLAAEQIPLTVCPLSNLRLRVVDTLADHPLPRMLAEGLLATVNSDDPAYFGGYVADNFHALADEPALGLEPETLRLLAANSFKASFLDEQTRAAYLAEVAAHRF
ncbi:adenosine deaminase [Actinospica robiniae]|uniref:adenosine deaminase n=1 Tax=Actinospica robiniae TaxID=304901 RepID=UPI00040AD5BC|nr:adenosine deaminase [Actinospica robiniae]